MIKNIKKIVVVFLVIMILLPLNLIANDKPKVRDKRTIGKAGTYFIEYGPEGEDTEVFRAHITYPKTVLNYENKVGLDAHDVVVKTGTFDSYSEDQLIQLGNAHAWSMETGQEIFDIKSSVSDSKSALSKIKQITYVTEGDTSVKVNVFEQDELYLDFDEMYMNQKPVVKNSLRQLSYLIVLLTVIPSIIFLILFVMLLKKKREATELLNSK